MDFRHSTSPSSSISSSASSSPVSIGWPSPTGSMVASSRQEFTSSRSLNCAYPSWPTGDSLSSFGSTAPSSFISDEDLFLDDEQYYLYEAPAPPRPAPLPVAMPLLPLYASEKPKKKQHYAQPDQQRRRNSRKQRHPSKPMTPISESPETVPE